MQQTDFTRIKMAPNFEDSGGNGGVTEYIIADTAPSASLTTTGCARGRAAGRGGVRAASGGGCCCCCCPHQQHHHRRPKKADNTYWCPACCYRQHCVMMSGVFLCFAVIVCVSVLIGLAVTSGRPHIATLGFVAGQCTTVSANLTGRLETCQCGGRFCHASFPCLAITVTYRGLTGDVIESILHEDEHVYMSKPDCSYEPAHCIQSQNTWYVDYYRTQWGTPGQTFPCHHHPTREGAIRRRTRSVLYTVHMLLWPTVCSVVTFMLALVVYCHCCPRCYID